MILLIAWYILLVSLTGLVAYHLLVFARLTFYSDKPKQPFQEPVSVVICARNEAQNLQEFLPEVLEQVYPEFEVIVVDDASTHDTATVLEAFQTKYKWLRVVHIQQKSKELAGKKAALYRGIAAAKHEVLLLTDADCKPASRFWLQHMANGFSDGADIVLGYGGYKRVQGLLNYGIQWETFYTALQYFSFALAGEPYMGVGRNLAYRKSIFQKASLAEKYGKHLSGDDDLLVNEMADNNVALCLNPEGFTWSVPEKTWTSWWRQKHRHTEAGFQYRLKHKLMLGGLTASLVLFYISLLVLLFSPLWIWALAVYAGLVILQAALYFPVMSRFRSTFLVKAVPFGGLFLSIFFITLGILSLKKVREWQRNNQKSLSAPRRTWN